MLNLKSGGKLLLKIEADLLKRAELNIEKRRDGQLEGR